MRFADPGLLWALLLVPLLGALLAWSVLSRRRSLLALAEARILDRMVATVSTERRLLKAGLAAAALALLILALARPEWGMTLEPVSRRGVDVVLAVDVSTSMLAEDLRPSRLAKAQSEAERLADLLPGDRIGIVAFAGSAATLCPLTLDHAAARIFIDAMEPGLLSDPGTSLGLAMKQIASTFSGKERRYKAAVLFSDGEDHMGEVEAAVSEAA